MEYLVALTENHKVLSVHLVVKMDTELKEKLKGHVKKMENGHLLN